MEHIRWFARKTLTVLEASFETASPRLPSTIGVSGTSEAIRSLSRPRVIAHAQSPPSKELPAGGGFSSPPPESSFRDSRVHDDALLQKQTRVWIEKVLNERCDEDKHISDLLANEDMNLSDFLADGEILLAMSKVFQEMLPVEVQKLLEKDSISSSKIAKKFPYHNVERFLRVCRKWKLKDIVLFTSSDVVNKVNTWQVCVSLRSLASEVRLRHPNVPDFCSFPHNYTGTMPTEMVESRRRNWESSSHSSVPISHDMGIGSRNVPNHSSVGDEEVFVPHLQNNLQEVSTNDKEATGESMMIQRRCDASRGQRDVEEDNSGQNNNNLLPLAANTNTDSFTVRSPSHEPCKVSQFSVGTTQHGQGGDRVCENCRDIRCIEDMKEMNNPLSNGGLKNCDDADKGEREDPKDENKTVGHQCKPMLKLIAGGIATVAAVGLLVWWQLRKKGMTNVAPHKYSLPKPTKIAAPEKHSSRLKQERAGTNKFYPALNLNFC